MPGIASIEIILFLPCSSFLPNKILSKLWNVIGILWASRSLKVSMYPFIRSIMETLFTFDMISWLKYYVFTNEFTWTWNHYEIWNLLATNFSHTVWVINSSVDIQSRGHERKGCLETQEGCRTGKLYSATLCFTLFYSVLLYFTLLYSLILWKSL